MTSTSTSTSTNNLPPLTVDDALQILSAAANNPHRAPSPLKLAVRVFRPGSIGGTPVSHVVHMQAGFDWDASFMLLTPEHPLTTLSHEDVEAIHTSAKAGQSWHAYQAYKQSAEQIKALKKQVETLTGERTHLLDAVPYSWAPGAAEGSEELRLGSNIAGGIRTCPDGTFESKSTLPGSTLASSGHLTAEDARQSLESTAGQWLKQLLG
jgi:hypothetical protein